MVLQACFCCCICIYAQRGESAKRGGWRQCIKYSWKLHCWSWKNHGIMFLNFCGNPVILNMSFLILLSILNVLVRAALRAVKSAGAVAKLSTYQLARPSRCKHIRSNFCPFFTFVTLQYLSNILINSSTSSPWNFSKRKPVAMSIAVRTDLKST